MGDIFSVSAFQVGLCGVLLVVSSACGSSSSGTGGAGGSGGSGSPSATTGSLAASTGTKGATSSGASPTSGSPTSATSGTSSATGGNDPFDATRQACIDKINALRTTKSLPAYTRWGSAESCVDQEVTHDETVSIPHDHFNMGSCDGANGQGECMGTAQTPAGIAQCLDLMWSEKDQAECVNCDSCPFGQDCNGCVFLSCGHYMALSSAVFTKAACGFSSAASQSWSAIDYQ